MILDLERRTKKDEKTYDKLKLFDAESKIKHLFESMDFKLDHCEYNGIISNTPISHITKLIGKIREKAPL